MSSTATSTITFTRSLTCDTCSGLVRCPCPGGRRDVVSARGVCPVPNYSPARANLARTRTGRGRHRRAAAVLILPLALPRFGV